SRLYKRDVDGAKKLLADAGFPTGMDITLTVGTNSAFHTPAAELVQQWWKDINVRTTIKPIDGATYYAQVQGRSDFDAQPGPPTPAPTADATLFSKYHSTGSANPSKISDPKLDQMIEKQTTLGRNPDERKKLLLDIQRYIIDQGYVHFFHTYEAPNIMQP